MIDKVYIIIVIQSINLLNLIVQIPGPVVISWIMIHDIGTPGSFEDFNSIINMISRSVAIK